MARPEWGKKRTCQACGARYYDMMRSPAVCPKCGAEANVPGSARPQRSRPAADEPASPKAAAGNFPDDAVELEEVDDALEENIDLDGDGDGDDAADLPA